MLVVRLNSGINQKFAHIEKFNMTNIVLYKDLPIVCAQRIFVNSQYTIYYIKANFSGQEFEKLKAKKSCLPKSYIKIARIKIGEMSSRWNHAIVYASALI